MSLDHPYDIARKTDQAIRDLRATIEMLGEFWPYKHETEMNEHFEEVEKYLNKKIEALKESGGY